MKAGTVGLIVVSGIFAFVAWAAFSPSPPPPSGAGGAPEALLALDSDRPVLLQFSATWCGPCQAVKPVVAELARELKGKAEVVPIDVDEQRELAAQYKVRSIPCFVVVKNRKEIARRTGAIPKSEMVRMLGL